MDGTILAILPTIPVWLIALLSLAYMAQSGIFKGIELSGGLKGQKARLGLETKKFEAETAAGKRMLKERRAMTKESYERLSKLRREERTEAREERFQRTQDESANRQLALVLAAAQAMTSVPEQMGTNRISSSMVDMLRR